MSPEKAEMLARIDELQQLVEKQRALVEYQQHCLRDAIHPAMICKGHPMHETPLTTLHRIWRQVEPGDRLRFLAEMLTPNERRAIQFGFEDREEPTP